MARAKKPSEGRVIVIIDQSGPEQAAHAGAHLRAPKGQDAGHSVPLQLDPQLGDRLAQSYERMFRLHKGSIKKRHALANFCLATSMNSTSLPATRSRAQRRQSITAEKCTTKVTAIGAANPVPPLMATVPAPAPASGTPTVRSAWRRARRPDKVEKQSCH